MAPGPDDTERAVRKILAAITLNDECLQHASNAPLEATGLNSVGIIELVYELEHRFSIEIRDDEVAPENFGSIGSLAALVARKCP